MSIMSAPLERRPWLRPKYLLFAAIGLMLAYVILHDESFLVHPRDPLWQHYGPFKWWLLPHGIAGACALLLGPMQFSDRLRARFKQLHRVVGRIYVAVCSSQRHLACISSTSRNARAIPDLSVLLQQPTRRCGWLLPGLRWSSFSKEGLRSIANG